MVNGVDESGRSNTLCLQLVEPRTGELSVVSLLQRTKKVSKNLEIILDVSGSMKTALGTKTRWATALEVLRDVLARLPADFNVGLRLYGHREGSRSPKTCTDSELVVPIGPLDREAVLNAANAVKPKGETPLVYSVLQAPADLKEVGGGTVILITDGEESCKGDVVQAAAGLKTAGQEMTLNIVGFTLTGQKARAALAGFAESTGGRFYAASTGEALGQALLIAAIEKFPYSVFDEAGKVVASGEAGGAPEALPPGIYKVVVQAGEQSITADGVQVALGQETAVRIVLKNDRLALEK
ncbi:MAG: VWA domain-containing protein [Acidobacteria bacterium]|nr:VWA domain-containing protein [Acidobacteriota bacterium]